MRQEHTMRRGFTMIELIFVIVIIGILAAVAIPKLTATRDDAKVAQIVANLRTFTEDVKDYYLAHGENAKKDQYGAWGVAKWDKVTDTLDRKEAASITTSTANHLFNIGNSDSEKCFSVAESQRNVTLDGTVVSQRFIYIKDGPDKTSRICVSALALAQARGLHKIGATESVIFAGQGVTF